MDHNVDHRLMQIISSRDHSCVSFVNG